MLDAIGFEIVRLRHALRVLGATDVHDGHCAQGEALHGQLRSVLGPDPCLQLVVVKSPAGELGDEGVHPVLDGQHVDFHAHGNQAVEQADVKAGALRFVAQHRRWQLALVPDHDGLHGALAQGDEARGFDNLGGLVHYHEGKVEAPQEAHARADDSGANDVRLADHVVLRPLAGALAALFETVILQMRLHGIWKLRIADAHAQDIDATFEKTLSQVVDAFVGKRRRQDRAPVTAQPTANDLDCRGRLPCAGRALHQAETPLVFDDQAHRQVLRIVQRPRLRRGLRRLPRPHGQVPGARGHGDVGVWARLRARGRVPLARCAGRLRHVGEQGVRERRARRDEAHPVFCLLRWLLATLQPVQDLVDALVRGHVRAQIQAESTPVWDALVRCCQDDGELADAVDLPRNGDARIVDVRHLLVLGDQDCAADRNFCQARYTS
mmetsp:Transcript_49822/g.151638  ORF Transcript_49822/g.151638 Transcript_49822/m.151638 type:complete len:437 (+) Transcript_49822:1121-2431(+)